MNFRKYILTLDNGVDRNRRLKKIAIMKKNKNPRFRLDKSK